MKPHEMTLSGLLLRMAELQDELAGLRERLGDFAAQLGGCVALMEELHDAAAAPSATAHGLAVPSPAEPCLPFDELDELFKETKTETKEENSPSIPPSKEERKDKKKENNNNNNNKSRAKRNAFRVPTEQEVADYVREKQYHFDAGHFFDYYAVRDWSVGNVRMKDWRAACRMWERNERKYAERKEKQAQLRNPNHQQPKNDNTYESDSQPVQPAGTHYPGRAERARLDAAAEERRLYAETLHAITLATQDCS